MFYQKKNVYQYSTRENRSFLPLEAPGEAEGEKQPERKKLSTESTNVWHKKTTTQNNQN